MAWVIGKWQRGVFALGAALLLITVVATIDKQGIEEAPLLPLIWAVLFAALAVSPRKEAGINP